MKSKSFCSLSLVLFLFLFLSSLYSLYAQPIFDDPLCGPKSLLMVFQRLGVKTSIEEVSRLSGYKDKEGTTMLGLYQAAKKKGFYAEGVKISLDELANLKIPVIVHLWDNHFLLVEGIGTDTLIITDPPKEPQLISRDKFQPFYSGFALVISRNKISLPKPETKEPDIRFDNYTYDFGKIEPGQKIEYAFTFKNEGDQELTIPKVKTTCGCTAAFLSDKTTPPKGKGEIKVSFDTAGRSGSQIHKVFVHSNDSVVPLVQLVIKGTIKSPGVNFSLQKVNFGEVKKRKTVSKEIDAVDFDNNNFKIFEIKSQSAFFVTTFTKNTTKREPGYKIIVTLKAGAPLGPFYDIVTIHTDSSKTPKIEIPVVALIVGDIEFKPSMLLFGLVKQGEAHTAQVTILSTDSLPLEIKRIENLTPFITTELIPLKESNQYSLKAILDKDVPEGSVTGTIVFYTNNIDQPKIEIPVYALVRERIMGQ